MRLRPAQALCLEPAQVRALRAPRFGAGAAQAGFWAVRGQRTPSRIFRITLERGGFWGIKFPQSATNLFRACASQLLAARGRVFRNGGRDSRRLRGGPSLSAFEVQRLEPSSPISGATSVELVSRPVRPALCMPPRSPWPLGHVRFNPTLPGGSPGEPKTGGAGSGCTLLPWIAPGRAYRCQGSQVFISIVTPIHSDPVWQVLSATSQMWPRGWGQREFESKGLRHRGETVAL